MPRTARDRPLPPVSSSEERVSDHTRANYPPDGAIRVKIPAASLVHKIKAFGLMNQNLDDVTSLLTEVKEVPRASAIMVRHPARALATARLLFSVMAIHLPIHLIVSPIRNGIPAISALVVQTRTMVRPGTQICRTLQEEKTKFSNAVANTIHPGVQVERRWGLR